MGKLSQIGQDLYDGTVSVDFVGRWRLWYAISAVVLTIAVAGLVIKPLNLGIEFSGGVEYRVSMPAGQANQENVEQIREAVADTGVDAASSPIVNTSGDSNIRIQTEPLSNDDARTVSDTIQETAGVGQDSISQDAIGATWGQQVADRALLGLVIFLVLVALFIWAYFREWKMSVAALVALAHDVIITVGVYSLSGFEVTPATVTGVLTILGFSLYDTVVVFDKVRENTRNISRSHLTYSEASNLAVNQTLVRSINTSVVALLPVGAILWVSVVTLGSGALKDLSLALFVGTAVGLYSSVFIATPLLVQLKEREAGVRAGDARAVSNHRRKEVDPFANVPAFSEDMPMYDEPVTTGAPRSGTSGTSGTADTAAPSPSTSPAPAAPARQPRSTAGERPASKPVSPSASAKRDQPSRKPRSRRDKK
jgi:preprotein translocase subunit SecF